jgi:3-phosphoshikimate 1-carboxyvinyltransferase
MIEIIPLSKKIRAKIKAPPSKAFTLRAIFVGALAEGKTILKNPLFAKDQIYAISALSKFGVKFEKRKNELIIHGTGGKLKLPKGKIFVGNSGLTARILASFSALCEKGKIVIDGEKRLRERPIQDLIQALKKLGVKIRSILKNGSFPIEVEGGSFLGGKTKLRGEISSQYFSSILICAPFAKKDVEIECVGNLSSKPYIDITQAVMADFGVKMENKNYKKFFIKAGQRYKGRKYQIEGDWTGASYFLAIPAICQGKIILENLKKDSVQGDKIFAEILEKMGCKVKKEKNRVTVESPKILKPINIDMNSYPDLVLTVAVLACFAKGKSEIKNIYHLHFKESDRISVLVKHLKKLGIESKEKNGNLIIFGDPQKIRGAKIETHNDHRVAMAFSIVGLKVPKIIIDNENCVKKSFPNFYQIFKKIGGNYKKLK